MCRVQLTTENLSVDHAEPQSRGGRHELDNLRLCCVDCNHLKHDRTEREMLQFLRQYVARFEAEFTEPADKEPPG